MREVLCPVVLLLATVALGGCAERTIYLRTDGQDLSSNPALRRQLELDRITCQTEPGDNKDCMVLKGYVSVPKEQAAAKQEQLAAIAAQNTADAAAPLVLPTPTMAPSKAAKKRKSKPSEIGLRSSQQ